MHILLDILCNEFIEHAFFLFQFLLRDQYSYYRPIGKVEFYMYIYSRDSLSYLYYKLIIIVLYS